MMNIPVWEFCDFCQVLYINSAGLTDDYTAKRCTQWEMDWPYTHTHRRARARSHRHGQARARTALPWKHWQPVHRGGVVSPCSSRPAALSEIAALLTVPIKKTGGGRYGRPSATTASPDSGFDLNAIMHRHSEASRTSPGSTAGLSGTAYELLLISVRWLIQSTADSSDRTVPHSRYPRRDSFFFALNACCFFHNTLFTQLKHRVCFQATPPPGTSGFGLRKGKSMTGFTVSLELPELSWRYLLYDP